MRLGLAIAAVCGLCATAQGQDNLGDGTGLQQDLSSYPQGRPPVRRNIGDDLRFRNAIVTGNVPTSGFRGDVGYASPFEFRGELGSDDLFEFRRDSLYSGLGGVGIRGTEAIQYQFALTTGLEPPRGLVGGVEVLRGDTAPSFSGAPGGSGAPRDERIRRSRPSDFEFADHRGTLLSQLRSSSSYTAMAPLRPGLVFEQDLPTGDRIGIEASSLRGVQIFRYEDDPVTGVRDAGVGGPDLGTNAQRDLSAPSLIYQDVIDRMRESASGAADGTDDGSGASTLDPLEERLRDLREQVQGTPNTPGTPELDEGEIRFDPETLEMIREVGGEIESFVPTGSADRDLYTEHMRKGEEWLAAERYFDAESRFVSALGIRPNDEAAGIGRVHAQLGAGMLESAAINLREALLRHPELAGVRYGEKILPNRDRLEELKGVARERAERFPQLEGQAGLLLAYLGHQTRDPEAVGEGLDMLVRVDRIAVEAGRSSDPVVRLVAEIWSK